MSLLLLKLLVTMVAVVGLSLVAERLSARLAGVLAGFPHGIAIVLWFIGSAQGAEFAARAAGFATAGLGANVALAWAYGAIARRLGGGAAGVAAASCGAVAVFLALAWAVFALGPGPGLALGLTLGLIGAVRLAVGRWAQPGRLTRPRFRPGELLLRAALAGAIVVLITGLAGWIGPAWAGLLAGFPVVSFPLLVILHARHGSDPVTVVVRHYPFGIMALVVYTLIVAWGFGALGMGAGTLAGLAGALAWLALAQALQTARAAGWR